MQQAVNFITRVVLQEADVP